MVSRCRRRPGRSGRNQGRRHHPGCGGDGVRTQASSTARSGARRRGTDIPLRVLQGVDVKELEVHSIDRVEYFRPKTTLLCHAFRRRSARQCAAFTARVARPRRSGRMRGFAVSRASRRLRSGFFNAPLRRHHLRQRVPAVPGAAGGREEILPWFGGSAAVWTTCLVFFQTHCLRVMPTRTSSCAEFAHARRSRSTRCCWSPPSRCCRSSPARTGNPRARRAHRG
jgi:hypothetical protein